MLRDTIIAAIRTGVAAGVGLLLAWLVGLGVTIPDKSTDTLVVLVFGATVAGYNALVSLLERRVSPAFGVLLGVPRTPAYARRTRTRVAGDRGHVDLAVILVSIASAIIVLAVWSILR